MATKTITKIQFRRGQSSDRNSVVLATGEPGWDTEEKAFYIGDGETKGGILVARTDVGSLGTGSEKSLAFYKDANNVDDAYHLQYDVNEGNLTVGANDKGKLVLPIGATAGQVLKCKDSAGTAEWSPEAGGGSSVWSAIGDKIYYNTDNVGIGTTDPSAKLEVVGDIKADTVNIGDSSTAGNFVITGGSSAFAHLHGSGGHMGLELKGNSNTAYIDFANDTVADYDARIQLQTDGTSLAIRGTSLESGSVKVGINTIAPNCDLTVVGCISATGAITSNGVAIGSSATLGTKQDLPGNQYADFTGIPDSATQINIMVIGADLNSSLDYFSIFCQIGDSGGLETTSYTSESWNSTAKASFHGLEKYRTNDTGFQVNTNLGPSATNKTTGIMCIRLQDAVTNTWIAEWRFTQSESSPTTPKYPVTGAGWKSLSGPLDRLRIALLPENHSSPADNMGVFSAGTVNISYI